MKVVTVNGEPGMVLGELDKSFTKEQKDAMLRLMGLFEDVERLPDETLYFILITKASIGNSFIGLYYKDQVVVIKE